MRRNSGQTADLESKILKRVRACNGISRVDLARELGLAASTAGVYVERLIEEGFLTESEKATRETGRPPRLLRMNPDGGEFIGVDFEARHIKAVAVDFSDRPQRNSQRLIEESDTAAQIIAKISEAIAEVLPSNASRLLAIGVGVPGIVDASKGIGVSYKYIASWRDVALAAPLEARFGVPVFLENNARSMALAELWFGQGRGHSDFLCIGIRSGIGVGMVLDGRLHRGASHMAGELGRWQCSTVSPEAAGWFAAIAENAPQPPELQEIASARAILNALKRAMSQGEKTVLRNASRPLSLIDVTHAAQQRDALTLRVLSEAGGALGRAIGSLALLLDPSRVMLAGPLTAVGDTFLQFVQAAAATTLKSSGQNPPEILNSTMGEFSGALGAAALALHQWQPAPFPDLIARKKSAKASRNSGARAARA